MKAAMSAISVDAAMAASMEILATETSEAPVGTGHARMASRALGSTAAAEVGGPVARTVRFGGMDHDSAAEPEAARRMGKVTSRDVATDSVPEPHHPEPQTAPIPGRLAAGESRPPLDLARLDVVSVKNPALRNGLLVAYLREARAALGVIQRAVAAGDADTVEAEAHRLSQMSEALGAAACGEAFSGLHSLSREGLVNGAAPLLARVSTELGRVERAASVLDREASDPA